MTARVLKVVNSAFFGLKNSVHDPVMAVNYIGIEPIKSLVLTTEAFQYFDDPSLQSYVENIWKHSEHVTHICRCIAHAEKLPESTVELCYMTELLHDIGILILMQNFSDKLTIASSHVFW